MAPTSDAPITVTIRSQSMLTRHFIAVSLTLTVCWTMPTIAWGWQSPPAATPAAQTRPDQSASEKSPSEKSSAIRAEAVKKDDLAARTLAQEATRLQNSGRFPDAANQWQRVIETYPDWPQIGIAWLNLGICNASQGKYQASFDPLKKSLQLSGNPIDTPKALMFLGYSQMSYGNQLSFSGDETDQRNSQIYLTTATQTLGKIVSNFPEFELADQALYFRGQSFYKLDRLNEAIAALEKVAQNEDATFRKDALFDMAIAYQRQREISLADAAYDDYLALTQTGDLSLADREASRLRTAKGKLALASVADAEGNADQATAIYKNAVDILTPVAQSKQSPLRDQAVFNQALAAGGLGDSRAAAERFEAVVAMPETTLRQQAAVLAGREWLDLGRYDRAIELLRPIAQSDSNYGVEAAIFLSTALRLTDQPQAAMQVAKDKIKSANGGPLIVPLLMEQADAMYLIPAQKKNAAALYQQIAADYPDSPAAGDAIYKSAAVHWETFSTDTAVELATRFIENYPLHPSIPGARSILADADIAAKRFAQGESIYRELARDFPNSPDVGRWALRIGWAMFLQKRFKDARDYLKGQIDTIAQPQRQSEAYHWIGESEFALKNYLPAIGALNQSLESTPPWDRLDATLFVRLQSELAINRFDDALATLKSMETDYPDSILTPEALLRTGEAFFDQQQFPQSIAQYQKMINQYPDSEYLPSALYGLGWGQLRSDQFALAESTFDELIDTFPTISLSQQARVGRSIAQRRLGKTNAAIDDLIAFIQTAPDGERKNNSLLELGLAYVESEKWTEAQATFSRLLAIQPKTTLADRAHYELAWVFKRLNNAEQSLDQFAQLVNLFPDSDLAPEAFFEVGSDAYRRQDFKTAAELFSRGLKRLNVAGDTTANNELGDLQQKMMYQLAWSEYQQKNFASAATIFDGLTKKNPKGALAADAFFMLGQSRFQLDEFEGALQAYQSAKLKFQNATSTNISQQRLLMLHGAQSANQIGEFQTAIELATPLTLTRDTEPDEPYVTTDARSAVRFSAWLEIGKSRVALGQNEGAIDAWQRAAVDLGKTGAQARVMKADLLLEQDKFEEAINEYKLVFYGYGGTKSTDEIRALQAYAIYETGRAHYIGVADASPRMKNQLIRQALKHFRYLVDNYPNQPLSQDAIQAIQDLESIEPVQP